MKSSHYLIVAALVGAFALSGCSENGVSFAGVPGAGGGGGTGGGTGGGGTGGGGSSSTEPRRAYQAESGTSIFDLRVSGDGLKIIFSADGDPFGTNMQNAEQLFALNISTSAFRQITEMPPSAMINFPDFDVTEEADRVVWVSRNDLVPGRNPNGWLQMFSQSTFAGVVGQVTNNPADLPLTDPEVSGNTGVLAWVSSSDFLGNNPGNNPQIFRQDQTASVFRQVTDDTAEPRDLALSSDGTYFAYVSNGDPVGMNADGMADVFVIDIGGVDHRQLTDINDTMNTSGTAISDTAQVVAFLSDTNALGTNADGNVEVFTVSINGTGLTQVTDMTSDAQDLDLSGNGQWVVFTSTDNLTGDNPNNDRTIFWAAADGSSIGQPLRDGQVPGSIDTRRAFAPKLTNAGDNIVFLSDANYSFNATGSDTKIYTTQRN